MERIRLHMTFVGYSFNVNFAVLCLFLVAYLKYLLLNNRQLSYILQAGCFIIVERLNDNCFNIIYHHKRFHL